MGDAPDPWRLAEWDALDDTCLIEGCEGDEIDQRGPVWLRDGSIHKACVEHWEAIMRVLGAQVTWLHDASRQAPSDAAVKSTTEDIEGQE